MNLITKRILSFQLGLLCTILVTGQEILLNVEYPEVVRVGQQFSVIWTVNSGGGELSAPSFEGFYKLMGPNTSFSSSTQIINGKITRETSYRYVYYLQALSEGKFVIGPATFTLKNKTYRSDSLHIEVIGSTAQAQNVPPGSGNKATDTQVQTGNEDLFLYFSLDRNEVFLGEHIVATVKIYTRIDISGINEIKYPSFNGFLKTDLDTSPLTSLQRENVDGTIYGTGVVQRFLLYPQITGEINIEPVQISVLVRQKTGQSDPFFGDFFSTYQTVPQAVVSRPLRVNVKPLPGSKPDDFSGVVGKLKIDASLNKDSVNVNDAVNLKITVAGNGNLKIAAAPDLKLPPDLEVYDPKITDNIKNNLSGSTGQKSFDYLLIPRHYGDFTIPPVTYSYFDVSTGKYERLTTPEFRFHARKSSDVSTGVTVYGGVSREDVKYLGKDIRFIRSETGKLKKTGNVLFSKRSFYSIYGFALFTFLIVLFVRKEHIRRNADINAVRNRKAAKVAVKRLREASRCLKNKQIDRFYEEILKALWGYLSDKLNIPVADLTRIKTFDSLNEKGVDTDKINTLSGILDVCEYARYAPPSSGTEAEKIYDGASQFIKSVENSIR